MWEVQWCAGPKHGGDPGRPTYRREWGEHDHQKQDPAGTLCGLWEGGSPQQVPTQVLQVWEGLPQVVLWFDQRGSGAEQRAQCLGVQGVQ